MKFTKANLKKICDFWQLAPSQLGFFPILRIPSTLNLFPHRWRGREGFVYLSTFVNQNKKSLKIQTCLWILKSLWKKPGQPNPRLFCRCFWIANRNLGFRERNLESSSRVEKCLKIQSLEPEFCFFANSVSGHVIFLQILFLEGRILAGIVCDTGYLHPVSITFLATSAAAIQAFLLARYEEFFSTYLN